MNYRVSKAADGRILVIENSGFVASYVDGHWSPKILFDIYEMRDELKKVRDPAEAEKLWKQAHAAIKKLIVA